MDYWARHDEARHVLSSDLDAEYRELDAARARQKARGGKQRRSSVPFYVLLSVTVALAAIYSFLVGLFMMFALAAISEGAEAGLGDLIAFLFSVDGLLFVWLPVALIGTLVGLTIREGRLRPPRRTQPLNSVTMTSAMTCELGPEGSRRVILGFLDAENAAVVGGRLVVAEAHETVGLKVRCHSRSGEPALGTDLRFAISGDGAFLDTTEATHTVSADPFGMARVSVRVGDPGSECTIEVSVESHPEVEPLTLTLRAESPRLAGTAG